MSLFRAPEIHTVDHIENSESNDDLRQSMRKSYFYLMIIISLLIIIGALFIGFIERRKYYERIDLLSYLENLTADDIQEIRIFYTEEEIDSRLIVNVDYQDENFTKYYRKESFDISSWNFIISEKSQIKRILDGLHESENYEVSHPSVYVQKHFYLRFITEDREINYLVYTFVEDEKIWLRNKLYNLRSDVLYQVLYTDYYPELAPES